MLIAVLLIVCTAMITSSSVMAQDPDIAHGTPHTTDRPGVSGPLPADAEVDWYFDVSPRLSFTPNPIGVGQELLVNMWVTPPPTADRFMKDFKIVITKPDGTSETITLDSYVADGTGWFPYIVDQVGTWKLQFHFIGMYFPAGRYDDGEYVTRGGSSYEGHYYRPASTEEQELVVQEEMVMSWHRDLPTDYWTRPISMENREWYQIGGNYPWMDMRTGSEWSGNPDWYGPFITAPNSSHIVWRVQREIAGIFGGEPGVYGDLGNVPTPNVIFMGRCYDTYYKHGVGNVAGCFDLRTGEIYYEIPTAEGGVTPDYIAYWKSGFVSVPGGDATSSYSAELIALNSYSNPSTLYKINAYTGQVSEYSVEGAGRVLSYNNGYFLTIRDDSSSPDGLPTYLYNWTVQGTSRSFASRLVSNQSFLLVPSFRANTYNFYGRFGTPDLDAGVTVITRRFYQDQVWGGGFIGVSLKTGQILYNVTTDDAPYSPRTTVADEGVYVCWFNAGPVRGYDIHTGKELWEADTSYPYGGFWGYDEAAAYGMAYGWSYDGVVAFNLTDGDIVWHYNDVAVPFESPYLGSTGEPAYSFNGPGIVADGKVYTRNSEHTATAPYTRGWSLHCIDAFTGEKIWKIAGPMNPGAAADGYLTAGNSYDGYMYVFGKGKSATTVDAPNIAVTLGQSVVITGTVTDQSPAQPGTPCVSQDSMDTQMNYLHMQRPIGGVYGNETITGIPVSIDTVDPNGNYRHLADVTSDGYSGTFGFTWEPDIPG